MHKIAICLLAMVFVALIAVPVSAQDRQLRQHHSIEIEVECLDTATELVRGLNGYNLESSVFLNEGNRHRGSQRGAHFTRRVDYWAFEQVQDALRGMGEVLFESESAHFLGSQIMDANAMLTALTQEIERLSIMMAASESLDVIIEIDARLSQVTWQRNNAIGTRNVLMSQASSPTIYISIFETEGDRPAVTPPRFGTRIAESFTGSLRTTWETIGNMLVFATRMSIPFVIYAALALLTAWVCIIVKRKRGARPTLAIAGSDTPIANQPEEITPAELAKPDDKEGEE